MTKQYVALGKDIIENGKWVYNDRTAKRCLTVISRDLTYNVGAGEFPICTTRKSYWKSAIAELIGYIRGYDSAAQFRALGTKTWDMNANETQAWLDNPRRKGTDDCGIIYGGIGRKFPNPEGGYVDTLKKVVDDLSAGIDDRREIFTFYHPGMFQMGALRPCMHTHHFSLLDGELYLDSTQASVDTCIGLNFNQVQVYTLLALIAQITGHKPAIANHKLVNVHIYEDQLDLFKTQLAREPYPQTAKLIINPNIKTLEDLETWVTLDDFEVVDYKHHDPIKFPFSA